MLKDTPVLTAYVDETGNHDLETEKSGASNLFICVAVLVNEGQIGSAESAMRDLSEKHFGGKEIKSSSIGGNHKRRLKRLQGIQELDFGYYALVVDKERVARDSGLGFKGSFYKHLNFILYRRMLCSGIRLQIVADQHGGTGFMASFAPYLNKKGLPNLFNGFSHSFENSANEPLIQLADLIAGSLGYIYDEEKRGDHSAGYQECLTPRQIGIGGWPLPKTVGPPNPSGREDEWDDQIRAAGINRAISFAREYADEDNEDRQMQVAVLQHLLFLKEYGEGKDTESIYADALIRYLEGLGYPSLSKQNFTSHVIGPLRDAGLVLAGSSDGYRLATSVRDIRMYLDHDSSLIEPMMARLKMARENIKHATANSLDILSLPGYECLNALMPAFENHQIGDISAIRQN